MALMRQGFGYPHYANGPVAKSSGGFVVSISETWSTEHRKRRNTWKFCAHQEVS